MKDNILIEVIVTNQCNKRCSYCDLDFRSTKIGLKYIDHLYEILASERNNLGKIIINFFGGEPLLNFEAIKYTIEKFKELGNISFTVGTNGILLTKEYYTFFIKNNIKIYLSIDHNNFNILKQKDYLIESKILVLNLILDPENIIEFSKNISLIVNGINNTINFMPVYTTKKWDNISLIYLLEIFLKYNDRGKFFNYYNGFSKEKQFVLESNGDIYQDLDSLLWLQKQYKIIPSPIKKIIESKSFLGNILNLECKKLLNSYSEKTLKKLILLIEKITDSSNNNERINYLFSSKISNHSKKILLFQQCLILNNFNITGDLRIIFSAILQDSKRLNYYLGSKDTQLFDCSVEFSNENGIQDYFKCSYFGTNMNFISKIFKYFGYKDSLTIIDEEYSRYQDYLKDDTITIGFKCKQGKLLQIKIYFDLVSNNELLIEEGLNIDIGNLIILKSYTFSNDKLIESKIYFPPDNQSYIKATKLLGCNPYFKKFSNLYYYDILFRYNDRHLTSIKFYYKIAENPSLISIIDKKFGEYNKINFGNLHVEKELGIDFSLTGGINKYSFYYGIYK